TTTAPSGGRGRAGGLTVAIPTWNHELFLPRSVGSALRGVARLREQGIPAEVLVIDDHSRDGSRTLLRQFEALHYQDGLRGGALARNVGLPAVRNLALGRASYQYVAFMDADNELIPENLHAFYRSIAATAAAVVYGNLLVRAVGSGTNGVLSSESFQRR